MKTKLETIDFIDVNAIKLTKAAFLLDQLRSKYYGMDLENGRDDALAMLAEPMLYESLSEHQSALFDTMFNYKGISMTLEIIADYLDGATASLDDFAKTYGGVFPKE